MSEPGDGEVAPNFGSAPLQCIVSNLTSRQRAALNLAEKLFQVMRQCPKTMRFACFSPDRFPLHESAPLTFDARTRPLTREQLQHG